MAIYSLEEAKTKLSTLIKAAQKGEEIVITSSGVPVAKLSALEHPNKPTKRRLGFYPIAFKSDLLEPTDPDTVESFYK
jgi:prevent-host-death family protein